MTLQPSMSELIRVFGRIGILSFGGPAAQIALMHRELVETRDWLTERQYLSALSFCMLLPGPEAMQLATYAGWRLRGVPGGLVAGGLFVLPGALLVLALALGYAAYGSVPLVEALFLGVKATVVIIVIEALLKVARRALETPDRWILAGLSFLGIFAFQIPFPLIILAAASYGALTARGTRTSEPVPRPKGTISTVLVWTALWLTPIAALWASGAALLTEIAIFFSKLAVVTFGGAYAVLAYMTQEVVQDRGWLTTAEMMDGLGLAETTPGPLILVTEFVGALTGYAAGGPALAVAAAAVTLWVTFIPCFLWIFAGAPYIDWIGSRPRLRSALSAITAAVVGVILNLSLWFAMHVVFGTVGLQTLGPASLLWPDIWSLDIIALGLAGLAAILLLILRWNLVLVLAVTAVTGVVVSSLA